MKCPECEASGQRSTVTPGVMSITAMMYHEFYDEDGMYHRHDPNTRSESFTCSNGHSWVRQSKGSCRCGWPDKPVPTEASVHPRSATDG